MITTKSTLKWHDGTPTRRGAYRVKQASNGKNPGWRYWDGERWGCLCRSRAWCMTQRMDGRNTPHAPVVWASIVVPVTDSTQLRLLSQHAALLAAVQAYEGAFNAMFAQCCSNGMKDAWGRPVSMAKFNEAHRLGTHALRSMEAKP